MITEHGKYYLYRHIRSDKQQPFYIGVGTKENNGYKRYTTEYRRAFVKFTRNKYWKSIVALTPYEVEILLESDDKEFIKKKEIEFISMYGRKNNNTGILCNMTDGGDFYNTGKKYENQGRNKLSTEKRRKFFIEKGTNKIITRTREVYVYNKVSGNYVNKFPQIKIASKKLKTSLTRIFNSLKNRCSANNYIFTYDFFGDKINIDFFNVKKDVLKPVQKISAKSMNVIETYKSGKDAADKNNLSPSNINMAIKSGIRCGGYYWKYKNKKLVSNNCKRNRYQPVDKVCPVTNDIIESYNSIIEAANKNNIKSTSSINYSIKNKVIRHGFLWAKSINN